MRVGMLAVAPDWMRYGRQPHITTGALAAVMGMIRVCTSTPEPRLIQLRRGIPSGLSRLMRGWPVKFSAF
jgi:hypothetical protein